MATKKENKKPEIGITAMKKLLKGSKTAEKEVTIKNKVTGAELSIIVKADADFTEIIGVATEIIKKKKLYVLKGGDKPNVFDVYLGDFWRDWTLVAEFTNINIAKLDADLLWDIMTRTDVMDVIKCNVNPEVIVWVDRIINDTLHQEGLKDTWRGLGDKLSRAVGNLVEGFGDVKASDMMSIANKLSNLDENKIVEAILNNGSDGTGHNGDTPGVREDTGGATAS